MVRSCPDPDWGKTIISIWPDAIFFPGLCLILFSHFCSFMVVWGFGAWIGFEGIGLSVDWAFGLCCGAVWVVLGWGFLYKRRRITLGKNIILQVSRLQFDLVPLNDHKTIWINCLNMEWNRKTIKHLWELTCILIIPLPYDLILTINEHREKSSRPIAT